MWITKVGYYFTPPQVAGKYHFPSSSSALLPPKSPPLTSRPFASHKRTPHPD